MSPASTIAAARSDLGAILYGLLPNWQHFWVADALNGNGRVPWGYVLRAGVYAALYAAAALAAGTLAFRRREIA